MQLAVARTNFDKWPLFIRAVRRTKIIKLKAVSAQMSPSTDHQSSVAYGYTNAIHITRTRNTRLNAIMQI